MDWYMVQDLLFNTELDFTEQVENAPTSKAKRDDIRAMADWYCMNLIAFVSFGFNYLYHVSFA